MRLAAFSVAVVGDGSTGRTRDGRCCAHRGSGSKKAEFEAGNGVLYVRNFLGATAHAAVASEAKSLRGAAGRERNSLAVNRLGLAVPRRGDIHGMFTGNMVLNRLTRLLDEPRLTAADFPIELRYYVPGAEMDWHQDDLLYSRPQIEVVYTVENTSDSETEWIDAEGVLHGTWTEADSLLIVQAARPRHRVRKLRRGGRTIVKSVYTTTQERSQSYDASLRSVRGH